MIVDTPTSEARITADVELRAGHDYALQIDHATALPRPVLIVTLEGPAPFSEDGKGAKEISPWLQPLEGR